MKKWIVVILTVLVLPIMVKVLADWLTAIDIMERIYRVLSVFFAQLSLAVSIPLWAIVLAVVLLMILLFTRIRSKYSLINTAYSFFFLARNRNRLPAPQTTVKVGYISEELRLKLLGYQNGGGLLSYQKRLCSRDYEPGTFTLSEIEATSSFMENPKSFDDWLDDSLSAEIEVMKTRYGRLLRGHSSRDLKNAVSSLLEARTDTGYPLKATIWYQEYSDVLRRLILFVLGKNLDTELELFPNLTVERRDFVFNVLNWLEHNKAPSLRNWLHLSIAAGLIGVNEKSPHTAASEIDKAYAIPLNIQGEEEAASVARVGEAVFRSAGTECRIDASEWLLQFLDISIDIKVKIVSFPDDYIETIFLLKYYQELISNYPNVEVDCVPRMIRCGNDARYLDFRDLLKHFTVLRRSDRFRVHDSGPKLGTVNITKLHPNVMALVEDSDFLDIRGARNYEMMQGINKEAFFGFMVCREYSKATTGLFTTATPLIYIRQPAGERSFSGFRQRHTRNEGGQMVCLCAAKDRKEKWEGGHWAKYSSWSDDKKNRYSSVQKFYSKGAIDFHKKYGDILEIEVKKYLDRVVGRILVVGCGSGKEVGYLSGKGHDALGIDFSVEAINLAKNRYPHLWDKFYVEDFYNTIYFKEGKFDGIVANAALVHLPVHSDMRELLRQFNERLSLKGKLYVRVLEKTDKREEYDSNLFNARRWFVYYEMEELVQMGRLCGFEVVEQKRVPHVQHSGVYWNNVLFQKLKRISARSRNERY